VHGPIKNIMIARENRGMLVVHGTMQVDDTVLSAEMSAEMKSE
jgi:hypothetical protein